MTSADCISGDECASTAWDVIIPVRGKMGIWRKTETAPAAAPGLFTLRGRDRRALAAALERLARLAPRLSGREPEYLAAQWCRQAAAGSPGAGAEAGSLVAGADAGFPAAGGDEIRVAFLADGNDQLAARARLAAELVGAARPGPVTGEGGVYLAAGAGGQVVLVFPGGAGVPAAEAAALAGSLGTLRWLDRFKVTAPTAVGAGLGEIAGLVWAGSLAATEAARLITQHGELRRGAGLTRTALARLPACEGIAAKLAASCGLFIASYEGPRSHVLGGPVAAVRELARQADALGLAAEVLTAGHALHTPAMGPSVAPLRSVLAQVRFGSPRRRLVSTVTGQVLTAQDDVAALLCTQLTAPVRFREALGAAAEGASLLVLTAPDEALAAAAACSGVPVVGFPASGHEMASGYHLGTCAAALFAAGALPDVAALAPPGPEGPAEDGPADPAAVIPLARPGVAATGGAGARGRFVETITMLRPGAELRAEVRLSPRTDPYLNDYLADGEAAFPAAMGLEAMAQAASALARQPMRNARQVSFGALVRVPGDGPALLRIRARARDNAVETVLLAGSGLQFAECARAVFVGAVESGGAGGSNGADGTGGTGQSGGVSQSGGAGEFGGAGGTSVADGTAVDAAPSGDGHGTGPAPPASLVDGADLYGTVCFQTGRFRRVAIVSGRPPRSCRAIVRGHDDAPWFEQLPDTAGAHELILGSPGLNDAALQVAQACVPGRVLQPGGCDSLTVTGAEVTGAVELRVFLISGPATRPAAAGDPAEPDEYVWDIHGYDAAGQLVAAWIGLRMRDAGPLPSRRARNAQRAQQAAVPATPAAKPDVPLRVLA